MARHANENPVGSSLGESPDRPGDVERFDLIVIGAGSGNSIPNDETAGLRVAVVDDGEHFGGTCLNVGCIPTKMFVRPAEIVRAAREAERLGVVARDVHADWRTVRDRIFARIDAISAAGEEYRATGVPNLELVRERVHFVDERTLRTASGRTLAAERIVIAAGSRPRALDALPVGGRVHTSDTIMRLDAAPERLAIVGGGSVASEFAAIFDAFGSSVTQIARSEVLGRLDHDVSRAFVDAATWRIHERAKVVRTDAHDDGTTLVLDDGTRVDADVVLVAAGRVPNTDRLGTPAVGFDHHDDGRLVVDEHQRVLRDGRPVPGVFALGDVANEHQLKHVANHEARIVQRNALVGLVPGADAELLVNELAPVPDVVFSSPQVASFGLTLDEARRAGYDAVEITQPYGSTAFGWALEDETSFCKLVVARGSATLLGAHIIGPDAAILLQPLVQAAAENRSIRGLARGQYWPHPAATEIVENALLRAEEEL